jgi:hypothetical protein
MFESHRTAPQYVLVILLGATFNTLSAQVLVRGRDWEYVCALCIDGDSEWHTVQYLSDKILTI